MTPIAARRELRARLESLGCRLHGLDDAPVNGHGDEGDIAFASEQREQVAGRRERVADQIAACLAALKRIEEGVYGTCESCSRPISVARLNALPETPVCVDCAARAERAVTDAKHREAAR